jgi:hypothetical protein
MNRVRALLLTAYLVLVIVGGVIYVQSVSNMVLYTEADQRFPSSLYANEVRIPRYVGDKVYSINCNFSFEIAIDSGAPGNPYDDVRLASERIGEAAESLGDAGPLIDPGGKLIRSYAMRVPADDSPLMNHLNANGNYIVILYGLAVSYGYSGTALLRQFWPGIITVEVAPVG